MAFRRSSSSGLSPEESCSAGSSGHYHNYHEQSQQQARSRRKTSSSSPRETKINIGSVVVYNFSNSVDRQAVTNTSTAFSSTGTSGSPSSNSSIARIIQHGHDRIQSYIRSFSNSSSPICRICHEGDVREELVSPCYCSGTIGLVHVSCMERWLSSTSSDSCELCYYKFKTYKTPKSLFEWLRDSTGRGLHQRSLVGDGVCFALLTPLAVVSGFLCIEGAHQQLRDDNRMEAGCLVALSSILALVYFLWTTLTVRFYYRHYKQWQLTNQNVKMVYIKHVTLTRPQPVSSDDQEPDNNSTFVVGPEIARNSSPRVVLHHVISEAEVSNQSTSPEVTSLVDLPALPEVTSQFTFPEVTSQAVLQEVISRPAHSGLESQFVFPDLTSQSALPDIKSLSTHPQVTSRLAFREVTDQLLEEIRPLSSPEKISQTVSPQLTSQTTLTNHDQPTCLKVPLSDITEPEVEVTAQTDSSQYSLEEVSDSEDIGNQLSLPIPYQSKINQLKSESMDFQETVL